MMRMRRPEQYAHSSAGGGASSGAAGSGAGSAAGCGVASSVSAGAGCAGGFAGGSGGSTTSPMLISPMMYRSTSLRLIMPKSRPFFPPLRSSSCTGYELDNHVRCAEIRTSPSTTTSRWTRRFLMSCINVPRESDAVQTTTPGKSGDRWFRASDIVKSNA